jgi:hypothetical protein
MSDSQRIPPPYRFAALTGFVVLVVYLATLAPTTAFWDTSEYIAAAKTLGIPHPPGNPLFVLIAHVFGLIPLSASYAVRINLFAAVTSALSAGLWFLVAERWLRNVVTDRTLRLGAAFAGVLVGAVSWTVWNQSTVNEKVYTLSMLSMAVVTWLAVHWGDDEAGSHRDRWLILIAFVIALSSTNHMMGVLALPAVAIYVLWTDWRVLLKPWAALMAWLLLLGVSGKLGHLIVVILGRAPSDGTTLIGGLVLLGLLIWALVEDRKNPLLYLGIAAVVVGLTPNYVFLPIRAGQFPPINEGEPVGFFSQALMDVLNRVQYGKPPVTQRQADIVAQFGNYWQYFSWQFTRDWAALRPVFTAVFAFIGLGGLWSMLKKDRRAGFAALAMIFTLTVALIWYLNFRYGFSMYPERTDITSEMREVRERDYFFICSFAFFGTLVAAGLGALAQAAAQSLRTRWAALPVLGLALVPFFGNRLTATRGGEYVARDFARDLLESVEPYAILITAGDNDTFPLWYAQEVEGIRTDVTLANLSLMNTEWHLRQIRRRPIPDFDPSKALDLWRPRTDTAAVTLGLPGPSGWPKPTTPVFTQTEAELDSLPEYSRVPKNYATAFGDVIISFGSEIIDRKDLATIFLIRDNLGKRPIYFAWSAGDYPDRTLGLSEWLLSQGLVRKLSTKRLEPGPNVILTPMAYADLARTRALLEAYRWQSAGRERPQGWVDAPSSSILRLYSIVYGGMAGTLREQGDSSFAARADSIARRVDAEIRKGVQFQGARVP